MLKGTACIIPSIELKKQINRLGDIGLLIYICSLIISLVK